MNFGLIIVHSLCGHKAAIHMVGENTVTGFSTAVSQEVAMEEVAAVVSQEFEQLKLHTNHIELTVHTRYALPEDLQVEMIHQARVGVTVSTTYHG
jgi:hypothetical protein